MRKRGGSRGIRGAERHAGDASALGEASRRDFIKAGAAGIAAAGAASGVLSGTDSSALASTTAPARRHVRGAGGRQIVLREQGSFMVGGTVITAPDGDTFHGDHAYVQYQIPSNARALPLVMWHGGGQFSKTWESTPDGRDGYQNIFLRRGFSTYILDQPRRGRAGRGMQGRTIPDGVPNESGLWGIFRLGRWPDFFPNVQFPGAYDRDALEQYFRQQTPDTGPAFDPANRSILIDAVAALFRRTGPAILVTHSASGRLGWLTAIASSNVKAIVCYETGSFVFPEGQVPPTPPPHESIPVSLADFRKLTRIPIQVVFGDNIPTEPTTPPNLDQWRTALAQARRFVDAVNGHGGDAQLLHLPDRGVFGNTHFPFSDLNSLEVADLLSEWLRAKRLDRRRRAGAQG
jgi:Alpha/beta hydrolase family